MPDRILRAELLESESWLALKDNSDRACYIACLLTADNFGQMPAGQHRLVKLWRPYGIDTPEKSSKVFGDLVDVDLLRRYTVDAKPYLYIPKFRQSRRFLGHIWPLSPWATDEEKQRLAQKTQVNHLRSPVNHGESPLGVGVGVGVGVGEVQRQTKVKTLPATASRPLDSEPKIRKAKVQSASKGTAAWEAYMIAYRQRYGTDPLRHATANAAFGRLVDKVGADSAPAVAAFYLTLNDPFYVKRKHETTLLAAQCDAIHTAWKTQGRTDPIAQLSQAGQQTAANLQGWINRKECEE